MNFIYLEVAKRRNYKHYWSTNILVDRTVTRKIQLPYETFIFRNGRRVTRYLKRMYIDAMLIKRSASLPGKTLVNITKIKFLEIHGEQSKTRKRNTSTN